MRGLDSTQLAVLGVLLVAWSFAIGIAVEGLKRGIEAAREGSAPRWFVRSLPLASMFIGALSGLVIFGLILEISGVEVSEKYAQSIPTIGAFLGVGGGAVAGQVVKAYKQTLLGMDPRLKTRD